MVKNTYARAYGSAKAVFEALAPHVQRKLILLVHLALHFERTSGARCLVSKQQLQPIRQRNEPISPRGRRGSHGYGPRLEAEGGRPEAEGAQAEGGKPEAEGRRRRTA